MKRSTHLKGLLILPVLFGALLIGNRYCTLTSVSAQSHAQQVATRQRQKQAAWNDFQALVCWQAFAYKPLSPAMQQAILRAALK